MKGIALHIGVNEVDPEHYSGWSGPLKCCEADVDLLTQITESQGFDITILKTAAATRDAVKNFITNSAEQLSEGDMFLVTYSGHGGQVKDVDGDEDDGKDETWCLFDGQLLDDELEILWSNFKKGTQVLVLSDSCHSGSVTKDPTQAETPVDLGEARAMPRAEVGETYRKNRDFYNNIQYSLPNPRPPVLATVRLLSGCQDDQLSYESTNNGRFTTALKDAFDKGEVDEGYEGFYQAILSRMPDYQTPNHFVIGEPNPDFDKARPFHLD